MNSKNIVLIGFMGSGKSSTARALARMLKREVFSSDERIIEREERLIAQIFLIKGEVYFRELERKVIGEISQKINIIIDCGGGVIKDSANIADLKKNGILIYLKTSPEWIYQRTKDNKARPLLNVEDPMIHIRRLLKEREPMYQSAANFSVETDAKKPEEVAQEIIRILKL